MRFAEPPWLPLLAGALVGLAAVGYVERHSSVEVPPHRLPPGDVRIRLAHAGEYSIEIAWNGVVTWKGEREVWARGEVTRFISPAEVRQLVAELDAVRFWERDDQGDLIGPEVQRFDQCSDTKVTSIAVTRGNDTHTIVDQHCDDVPNPLWTLIEARIAAVTKLAELVDGPVARHADLAQHWGGHERASLGDALSAVRLGMAEGAASHDWMTLADAVTGARTRVGLAFTAGRLDRITVPLEETCAEVHARLVGEWGLPRSVDGTETERWLSADGGQRVSFGARSCELVFERALDVVGFIREAAPILHRIGEAGVDPEDEEAWSWAPIGIDGIATFLSISVHDGKVACVRFSGTTSSKTGDAIEAEVKRSRIAGHFERSDSATFTLERGACAPR